MSIKSKKMDSRKLLAYQSIIHLFESAIKEPEYSNISISQAINYKKRHRVPFTWKQKRLFCKNCLRLYEGKEKVRVTKLGLIIICPHCFSKRTLKHPQIK